MTDIAPKTPPKPRAKAARPARAAKIEDLKTAIALIEQHGRRMDILQPALTRFTLKLSFSTGTHHATMLGLTGTATSGEADAVQAWARAARRALLQNGGA